MCAGYWWNAHCEFRPDGSRPNLLHPGFGWQPGRPGNVHDDLAERQQLQRLSCAVEPYRKSFADQWNLPGRYNCYVLLHHFSMGSAEYKLAACSNSNIRQWLG